MQEAIIILGHGSRAPEATETLARVTEMVRNKSGYDRVEYASLQLSEPDLNRVVQTLSEAGVKKILIIPFLIATGQHIKVDVPNEIAAQKNKHPEVEFHLGSPMGADPRLADILLERVSELERLL